MLRAEKLMILSRYKIPALLTSSFIFLSVVLYFSCNPQKEIRQDTGDDAAPTSHSLLSDSVFVGEGSCKDCHLKEYQAWKTSHHFRSMEIADSSSVLGNFDDITFVDEQGNATTFYKKDGGFWVSTKGEDGKNADYRIVYTFGFTPLQQYIIEYPQGRFQCLSTAWDSKEKKWFDLYKGMKVVHTEWLHQSRGAMTWNAMCADCHSTNLKKNFDETKDAYDTKFSIINVSCEACHGPGKDHVEQMKKDPSKEDLTTGSVFTMTKTTAPKTLVDQCARCHSRREQLTLAYNHKGTFMDHYFPQVLTENVYHADGQILDEVYVYGSFLQSKMYMNNVTCTDCHDPHSMQLKLAGNALCGQCHDPNKFDDELHTFHSSESEGGQCVNCHMAGKYYMVNDFRRDHSFRIPRPDLTLKYGIPNACGSCHTDRSEEWVWTNYKKWYGEVDSTYYTDILSAGRAGDPSAMPLLEDLAKNHRQSPLVRATAVTYLGRYMDDANIQAIMTALRDKEELVRGASVDVLSQMPLHEQTVKPLLTLLQDEKRAVRIKAFNALAPLPEQNVPPQFKDAYGNAKKEFENYLVSNADFPGGQVTKALYFERSNRIDEAIAGYLKAIEIDDHNNIARNNLANLYYRRQQFDEAEKTFRKIVEQEPEFGQTYYSLGLLLAEKGEFRKAATELEIAKKLLPENVRLRYNLGLIYQQAEEIDKAESTFSEGLSLAPKDEALLYALFYLHTQIRPDPEKAFESIRKLSEYYPENTEYRQLLKNFQSVR